MSSSDFQHRGEIERNERKLRDLKNLTDDLKSRLFDAERDCESATKKVIELEKQNDDLKKQLRKNEESLKREQRALVLLMEKARFAKTDFEKNIKEIASTAKVLRDLEVKQSDQLLRNTNNKTRR